jgi:hypothetical protein
MSRCGTGTGKTSNMNREKRRRRFPMARRAQGDALTVPNRVPVRPAARPRIAYRVANPTT